MKVYISGKIGEEVLSEATRQKFAKAEEMLKSRGFRVFNPTTSGLGHIADYLVNKQLKPIDDYGHFRVHTLNRSRSRGWYSSILLLDLEELSWCDAIYMLPDFLDSPGAKAEHAFAIAAGKQVYYDDELYRDGTLRSSAYDKNRLPNVAP